ncbi:MAG: hypothetical protein IJZ55_11465 [Lachnospiraceae bacterium]|nr:hypothetical protein [Lachnospiraceae bacterium]
MGYTNGLWEGMFGEQFGAWRRTGKICFKTVAEGADNCTLLLFGKGKEEPKKEVPMTRIGNSAVFYTEVSEKDAKGCMTYLFAGENGRFTDVYAKAVCGKEEFGIVEEDVRPMLPNPKEADDTEAEQKNRFVSSRFSDLIVYKLHVRGFTKHASSGVKYKGTFMGLMEKIPYLKELGINAVLLMPVYEFDECMEVSQNCGCLSQKQLAQYEARYGEEFVKVQKSYETGKETKTVERVNYWGYSNNNFYFAPKASYAADKKHPEEELCLLVNALHEAGIAVFYEFYFGSDVKRSLITECLRYWTYRYGADGFRLIGENGALPLLLEDPYLAGVKFFVTDTGSIGSAGAQSFEDRRVAMYNDGFRNVMRRFVKGDENMVGEFVGRFCEDKKEFAQIQYIADQNGFSVYDLFAYDRKHNEENGEENKDGEDYNYSWNCGIEGETQKKKINALRAKLRKNALSMVLLSRSVPMLFMGDEFGQTKKGNNNAYCQDNEISWLNWRLNKERQEQFSFVKDLIELRKSHGILSGGRMLRGSDWKNVGLPDVSYHGVQLWQPDYAPYSRTVSVLLNGAYGEEAQADLYLLFNMHWEELLFALPTEIQGGKPVCNWEKISDTSGACEMRSVNVGKEVAVTADESLTEYFCKVPARTVVVLERKRN